MTWLTVRISCVIIPGRYEFITPRKFNSLTSEAQMPISWQYRAIDPRTGFVAHYFHKLTIAQAWCDEHKHRLEYQRTLNQWVSL